MTTQIIGGITVLYPDSGKILTNINDNGVKSKEIWLGNVDNISNYKEVDDVVEVEPNEVEKLQAQITDNKENLNNTQLCIAELSEIVLN